MPVQPDTFSSATSYHSSDSIQPSIAQPTSFIESIREFSWRNLTNSYYNRKSNKKEFAWWSSKLFLLITPAIIASPKVAVNTSCKIPPPLRFSSNVPICKRLKTTRKVGVVLKFKFDADILEIHFHELDDIVDIFFLIESSITHYWGARKPLIWDLLQRQSRFEKFLHKVVYFVVDDQDILAAKIGGRNAEMGLVAQNNTYDIQSLLETMQWVKFKRWNNITNYFDDDDLLGFGDSDKIPNRNMIHYLKHCEMPTDPINIGIWVSTDRIEERNVTYLYGHPTYWKLKTVVEYKNGLGAKFNHLDDLITDFIVGGVCSTHYGYFPLQLTKMLTTFEPLPTNIEKEIELKLNYIMNELKLMEKNEGNDKFEELKVLTSMEMELTKSQIGNNNLERVPQLKTLKLKFPEEYRDYEKLPWFYDCNRERYPSWEGKHDTRLED